jgi:DNA primase
LADWSSLTKQVKDASDIVAVVGGYLTLQPAGRVFKAVCPFHNDSRPSLQVDPQWQNFKCWSCGKGGSVFDFVMGMEKVEFREALELLARRANIPLPSDPGEGSRRAVLLDAMQWACKLYHKCLLDSPLGEAGRRYLAERHLTDDTIRKWELGYAPDSGDWLTRQAGSAPVDVEDLTKSGVGLLGPKSSGSGYYDMFRERVMFPIRDVRGQVVGFGGRILPSSPYAGRVGKYINSCDTPLFNKSELIYGLDQARLAGQAAGSLAVVEGYTDVLMAHQAGVTNVVATMGTALTPKHVRQLRRYAPRVVLVYDADEGGSTGVDRALELFVREDADLAIAALPAGMDPADLLAARGPEPFQAALATAADALDFKLDQILAKSTDQGIEGTKRAVEAVLGVLALVPDQAGPAAIMKRDLVLNRIGQRFGLTVDTLKSRLDEVRKRAAERSDATRSAEEVNVTSAGGSARPDALERELLEVLLADPMLVSAAKAEVATTEILHPGLSRLLGGLYALYDEGLTPDLDALRLRIVDNPPLAQAAVRLQEVGMKHTDRSAWLRMTVERFGERRKARHNRELMGQLTAATDASQANEIFRKMQSQSKPVGTQL